MKTLVCVNAFGNFVSGDELMVPEDVAFDSAYWALKQYDEAEDKKDDER